MIGARPTSRSQLNRQNYQGAATSSRTARACQQPRPPTSTIPSNDQQGQAERVRLHVTPFTPELLKIYIPPSLLPLASNISFHTVQTFPEKGFGYVELPAMEAQKMKKKLSGTTLRGSKVRIETARPEKKERMEVDDEAGIEANDGDMVGGRKLRSSTKGKKDNAGHDVLEGFELPAGRKVKRGWTEVGGGDKYKVSKDRTKSKDKKREKEAVKSKYLKTPELLFKTTVPANKVESSSSKSEKASKKKKEDKPRNSEKTGKEVVVHEFEKTKNHARFSTGKELSSEKKKLPTEFIEGKGWVDDAGNVIEAAPRSKRPAAAAAPIPKAHRTVDEKSSTEATTTINTDSPALSQQDLSPSPLPKPTKKKTIDDLPDAPPTKKSKRLALRSTTADSPTTTTTTKVLEPSPPSPPPTGDFTEQATSPKAEDASAEADESKSNIHPLEALFKRPTTTSTSTPSKQTKIPPPISTTFSFFPPENNNDVDSTAATATSPVVRRRNSAGRLGALHSSAHNPPQTPFTRQDLHYRGLRSAAPTPDTAAIGRGFRAPWMRGDGRDEEEEEDEEDELNEGDGTMEGIEEEEEEEDEGEEHEGEEEGFDEEEDNGEDGGEAGIGSADGMKGKEGKGEGKEESEFAKWFWEHRGENNRAWKKRRRDALKAVRQRENKRVARRLV